MEIVRLLYYSEHHIYEEKSVIGRINDILAVSVRNNRALGITGVLLFDNYWFLQLLEGERDTVWCTFKTIEHDQRHRNVVFIAMEAIPNHNFAKWSMGYADKRGENSAAFAPYLHNGQFKPGTMRQGEILSLLSKVTVSACPRETPTGNLE